MEGQFLLSSIYEGLVRMECAKMWNEELRCGWGKAVRKGKENNREDQQDGEVDWNEQSIRWLMTYQCA